jgi:hypothetical protein
MKTLIVAALVIIVLVVVVVLAVVLFVHPGGPTPHGMGDVAVVSLQRWLILVRERRKEQRSHAEGCCTLIAGWLTWLAGSRRLLAAGNVG